MKYYKNATKAYWIIAIPILLFQKDLSAQVYRYPTFKGLVMAGYQGWFNTFEDGANRGWHHYQRRGNFAPGSLEIDLWPDMTEYKQHYTTPFRFPGGKPATVFSSYDKSTVDLHFKWMKEYGIDGVFMQRFIAEIRTPSGKRHFNTVLENAMVAAKKQGRAICIMYDLSGMNSGGSKHCMKRSMYYMLRSFPVRG